MAEKAKPIDTAKMLKLLEAANDLHAKAGLILEEFDELLSGRAGIATLMKDFERAFDGIWGRRYAGGQTGRYIWRYAADRPHLKKLIKQLGPEEVARRAANYLTNDDPFLVRSRHPFGLFVSGINSYSGGGDVADLELSPPIDCRHTPRCSSDQEHTKRQGEERRA